MGLAIDSSLRGSTVTPSTSSSIPTFPRRKHRLGNEHAVQIKRAYTGHKAGRTAGDVMRRDCNRTRSVGWLPTLSTHNSNERDGRNTLVGPDEAVQSLLEHSDASPMEPEV